MSHKMLWSGLAVSVVLAHWIPQAYYVGAIFMGIGLILLWLDK